jgi:signal transduction histidine kinase
LAVLSPGGTAAELVFLPLLAVIQLVEPRISLLETAIGTFVITFVKLALGYLLIGYTGGVESSYYLILLLPVVSAATSMSALATAIFTALACGSYLSFLLYIDWSEYVMDAVQVRELCLRLAFMMLVAYLTYTLAASNRVAARKYQAAAEELAKANRSLADAEDAVRRSERLAALGQLTAGLAHELRNPLGTIRASAEMLATRTGDQNGVTGELSGFIAAEVDRANALVTRFLEFARPTVLQPKIADLAEVVDRALEQVQRQCGDRGVTIYKNYDPAIRPFEIDAELIERAVYNLVLNAAQASPDGGVVTVKLRQADGQVEISVIDRGSGIENTNLESIFNPFFTTKPGGVGLGLAIVSKVVDEHRGRIAVESEPGKGTVMRVFLPLDRRTNPPLPTSGYTGNN